MENDDARSGAEAEDTDFPETDNPSSDESNATNPSPDGNGGSSSDPDELKDM